MNLEFRKFSEPDYLLYKDWFLDVDLNRRLGDVDDEWLEYILNEQTGDEWAVYLKKELVCVIGVVKPNESHPFFTISNIAVYPKLKRSGLATMALNMLMDLYLNEKVLLWRCYVEPSNVAALRFFKSNGWRVLEIDDPDRTMICLYTEPNQNS